MGRHVLPLGRRIFAALSAAAFQLWNAKRLDLDLVLSEPLHGTSKVEPVMDLYHFLPAAVYLIAVMAVCVALFRHIGLGSVLGLLVAGIIVGPYTPGPVATTEVELVREFTHFGVVLLLFLIGLEMDPARLWRMRREVFGLGLSQVLVTGVVLALYSYFFISASSDWTIALGLGLTFALSSTAFSLQMLDERGELVTPHGRTSLAILLMQDMAVVPLLALVPLLAVTGAAASGTPLPTAAEVAMWAAVVGGLLFAGRYAIPWTLDIAVKQRNADAFVLIALLSVLGAAWAMTSVGLSMELGAFAMGMLLSRTIHHHQLTAHIQPYKGILLSLFFISVGMSIDLRLLLDDLGPILRDVVAIMVIKAGLLFTLCLVFGIARTTAIRVSLILAQCGEFGFVLLALGYEVGALSEHAFLSGLVVIAASMLATPFFAKAGDIIARHWADRARPATDLPGAAEVTERHVVIGGYGRMGRTLCTLLETCSIPYTAVDADYERVAQGKRSGHHVYVGDIRDINILNALGVGNAALVVISIDNVDAMLSGVSHLRQFYPHLPVLVRVRDLNMSEHVIEMGATSAFPEAAEASLQLSQAALMRVGVPEPVIDDFMAALRENDYSLLRSDSKEQQRHLADRRAALAELQARK